MTTTQGTHEVRDYWAEPLCGLLARPSNAMLSCAARQVELTR
jgi:hypothetical protein